MRKRVTQSEPAPTSASAPVVARPRFPVWLMAVLLALVTIVLYWPATGYDFVSYDDPKYVTSNPYVQAGLTWEGLLWAFGRVHGDGTYWHPLTWVSHMLDCQFYGLKPWGHHLTSVLVHAVNAVLVFLVFRRLTGAFWRCAVLAAFFALHPLQVDSVAWVTERKNLLSALFWLLTMWAYIRYAEGRRPKAQGGRPNHPTPNTQHATCNTDHASRDYALALFLFALGLMCKPVLVTLPLVLLLLDYWPLQRLQLSTLNPQPSTLRRLLLEKVPFLALAALSGVITFLAHRALGILGSGPAWPWDMRLQNTVVSYVRYLGKTFWPCRLAVFYPYPDAWPSWEPVTCGLLLLVISALVLGAARSRPWWLLGWLWFLGVLVPFIGLVQAGEQAMADRFMYLPAIGLIVAVLWGLHGLAKGGRYQRVLLSVAGSAAIVLCMALTRQQLRHWKDSESLFRHALAVTENNCLARISLGNALAGKGRIDEAIRQFQEAIRLKPDYALAYYNLGIVLVRKGQIDEAIRQYQEALRRKPDYAEAHNNLGNALREKGRTDEAIRQLQEALRLKPDNAEAHNNLGTALSEKGRIDEAIRQYQEALRLKPDYATAHNNLGIAFGVKGRIDEAIRQYQEALRLKPDYADAHNNLGNALGVKGRTDEAIRQLQEALRLKPDNAEAHNNLGTTLGEKGQIDEAILQFEEALRLKPDAATVHNNLGIALSEKGRTDEAIRQFEEAIRLKPDFAGARTNLAQALQTKAAPASR